MVLAGAPLSVAVEEAAGQEAAVVVDLERHEEATLLVAVEEEEEEDEEEAETEAAAGAGMASDVEYISVVVSSCHIMLTDALGSPVMAPHWSIHVGWLRS